MNLPNCSHFSCRFACRTWTAGEVGGEEEGGGGGAGGEEGGGGMMETFLVAAHQQDAPASLSVLPFVQLDPAPTTRTLQMSFLLVWVSLSDDSQ